MDRPILMSTEMIKAYMAGRKTMTRRVIKPQPENELQCAHLNGTIGWKDPYLNLDEYPYGTYTPCPYGQAGDTLWFREKALYWDGGAGGCSQVVYQDDQEIPHLLEDNNRLCIYREVTNIAEKDNVIGKWKWKFSIFMPKWAARFRVSILSVKVERVQDISEEDAEREGLSFERVMEMWKCNEHYYDSKALAFGELWDSINGKKYPWSSNPWVWVIEFERYKPE